MKAPNRGFTLIELLVALVLTIFVIEIAWKLLGDQRQNMVGIRQRLRAQSVAREALKSIESEIRIAGFSQGFTFSTGTAGRIDSLGGASALTNCSGIQNTNGASVDATDGAANFNDTLTLAFPTVVLPSTGTDCSQIQWSRYYVDGSGNLIRVSASTLAGLATSTSSSIAAKGVDVFQVRLGVMGGGAALTTMLASGTEACCTNASYWNGANASVAQSGSNILVTPPSPRRGACSPPRSRSKRGKNGATRCPSIPTERISTTWFRPGPAFVPESSPPPEPPWQR